MFSGIRDELFRIVVQRLRPATSGNIVMRRECSPHDDGYAQGQRASGESQPDADSSIDKVVCPPTRGMAQTFE